MLVRGVVAGSLTLSVLGAAPGIGAAPDSPSSLSTTVASAVAAKKVKPRSISFRVSGDLLGSRATLRIKGVKGKAKGTKKTLRVRKRKTVKRLKPGVYRITAERITVGGRTATPSVKPKRVLVSTKRGAAVAVVYRAVVAQSPQPTPSPTIPPASPPPPPTSPPTTPPATDTVRVSTDVDGLEGNGYSVGGSWSPDGTRVAFSSDADNLVPGDTNGYDDVFVKTVATGAIQRVSTSAGGTQGDDHSSEPVWSPDGGRIAFTSRASTLGPERPVNCGVFVKDLSTGTVEAVSTAQDGTKASNCSGDPVWSPDGTRIAFYSDASNLVMGDTNNSADIFVKTLATGAIERISTDSAGAQSNGYSAGSAWSPDGTQIAFTSSASNLVGGDTNSVRDVFVKTLATGAVRRASVNKDDGQGNGASSEPDWSPDGSRIAFTSSASDLVDGDTNSQADVFVKTLGTGSVVRVSTDENGAQGAGSSGGAAWSPTGEQLAFDSASDLVGGDGNGVSDVFVKTLATGAIQLSSVGYDGGPSDCGGCALYYQGSFSPQWSPGGTQVVFNSFATNLVVGDTNDEEDVFVTTVPK